MQLYTAPSPDLAIINVAINDVIGWTAAAMAAAAEVRGADAAAEVRGADAAAAATTVSDRPRRVLAVALPEKKLKKQRMAGFLVYARYGWSTRSDSSKRVSHGIG